MMSKKGSILFTIFSLLVIATLSFVIVWTSPKQPIEHDNKRPEKPLTQIKVQ